jgi:hypothetical protein
MREKEKERWVRFPIPVPPIHTFSVETESSPGKASIRLTAEMPVGSFWSCFWMEEILASTVSVLRPSQEGQEHTA